MRHEIAGTVISRGLAVALSLAAVIRAAGWHDAAPGTRGDLLVLLAITGALGLEAVLLRTVWVSRGAGAQPVRLALALAIAIVSSGMVWRLWQSAPGYLPVVLSGEPGGILAHRRELLVLMACAVFSLAGLCYGAAAAVSQCGRLAWHAAGGSLRRRARSDLHGSARFMTRREMLRLHEPGSARNIILGEFPGPGRRLMHYRLHGSITTFAPPRTGKTALVIQNLLDPRSSAWRGSTVTMDPRGNVFCVVARARREAGRTVRLVDPFGVVETHRDALGDRLDLPDPLPLTTLNPLDLVRFDDNHGADIDSLLRVILSNPAAQGGKHNRHFHDLVMNILKGMISWVRQSYPAQEQTLRAAMDLCRLDEQELRVLAGEVERFNAGETRFVADSVTTLARLFGTDEGTSFATTMMIELAFAGDAHIGASLQQTSFDPMELADGNTDVFIVVPQQYFRMSAPFLRLWMAVPTMVAHRCPPERGILVYLDEMASIGYLDPVVDSFTMAAGSGVHYWCFVQTLSALDASYGREARALILENAEVVQALGFPRYAPELAAEFARAIGHATFLGRQDSRSGSITHGLAGTARDQSAASEGLVKETVIAPDDLLRLPDGEQIVIASTRQAERNAMRLRHARYWTRRDCARLTSPDPLEVRRRD